MHLPGGAALVGDDVGEGQSTGCDGGSSGRPPKMEGFLWIWAESSKAWDFVVM